MKHRFLPGAEAEYLESIRFYEDRRSKLGAALISEFERSLRLALERPGHGASFIHPASGASACPAFRTQFSIRYWMTLC